LIEANVDGGFHTKVLHVRFHSVRASAANDLYLIAGCRTSQFQSLADGLYVNYCQGPHHLAARQPT
jgi:hypothetical protein